MIANRINAAFRAVAIVLSCVSCGAAATPEGDSDVVAIAEKTGAQLMLELPVRVVDGEGKPVAKAKITPWALRSSQGHGRWSNDDKRAQVDPQHAISDAEGKAAVLYPYYRDVLERIRTTSVSLFVDHPGFAYVDDLHIDVPLEIDGPHAVELTPGVSVEVRPLIDGASADLDDVFTIWSDGRSWQKGAAPEKSADGTVRIPAMRPGENSLLLVKLDGDRATHFSAITEFKLVQGERKRIDLPLRPSIRITGALSDNVPRPVRNGRVKAQTLNPGTDHERVGWWTWTPVQPDGTFTIDGWPADQQLQLIVLCDGYVATSGKAPDVVKNPRDPASDPFLRPQLFGPPEKGDQIEVEMTPLARCTVTVVDEDDHPIAGVSVMSWPNVGWWNLGSQIYCHPLVRSERVLRERDYMSAVDEEFPQPFAAVTDATGKATLELPVGRERLAVSSEVYELPVFLGQRDVGVKLTRGVTTEVTLRLQPRGTEKLGEWDKLAGVVFGCSTREGRRICALPGVQKKMEEFATRFREAKNQRDPQLLSEAYSAVADAFLGVGDFVESEKWRQKAVEQASKAKEAAANRVEP